MAASPMGPHPNTATPSPASTSAWSAACMPTASGSANAATSRGRSSGTRWSRPRSASVTSRSGVSPPSGAPLPIRPRSSLPGWHHDPVADPHGRHVGPDPVDDARHLVAEAHRGAARSGEPAHLDVGQIAAADAAGGDPDHHVARSGVGLGHLVDPDVTGPMYPNLEHRDAPVSSRRAGTGTPWPRAWRRRRSRCGRRDRCGDRRTTPGRRSPARPHSCRGHPELARRAPSAARSSLQKPMWWRFEYSLQTHTEPGTSSISSRCGASTE